MQIYKWLQIHKSGYPGLVRQKGHLLVLIWSATVCFIATRGLIRPGPPA